jgi:hypothetical protein
MPSKPLSSQPPAYGKLLGTSVSLFYLFVTFAPDTRYIRVQDGSVVVTTSFHPRYNSCMRQRVAVRRCGR